MTKHRLAVKPSSALALGLLWVVATFAVGFAFVTAGVAPL